MQRSGKPQDPQPPYPYSSQEVVVCSSAGQTELSGTLCWPAQPIAAVLLIPGSGQHDRDETLLGHKPFWVLADYLGRMGIATLRLDDRGVGLSRGDKNLCTHQELLKDTQSALDFLRQQPQLQPVPIGVLGHSEGAILAIMAGVEALANFVITLAGPGLPSDEVVLRQSADIARSAGASPEQIAHEIGMNQEVFALLKSPLQGDLLQARVEETLLRYLSQWPGQDPSSENLMAHATLMSHTVMAPIFRSLLRINPADWLKQLRVPMLALFGALDLQVEPWTNLAAMQEALTHHPNATLEVLPQLNHLLQTAQSGSLEEYEHLGETLAPLALKRIGHWIVKTSSQP